MKTKMTKDGNVKSVRTAEQIKILEAEGWKAEKAKKEQTKNTKK